MVDLGTGDGKAVLRRAAREPRALVLGIDADARAMAVASRRAARPARRGGLVNAAFVVGASEHPPDELIGRVDELTIQFPWGSLLRGTLGLDRRAAAGIAALLAMGGRAVALIATAARDHLAGIPTAADLVTQDKGELADRWQSLGLKLVELREASVGEVAASGSSWARRLLASGSPDRMVARIVLLRAPGGLPRPRSAHLGGVRIEDAGAPIDPRPAGIQPLDRDGAAHPGGPAREAQGPVDSQPLAEGWGPIGAASLRSGSI